MVRKCHMGWGNLTHPSPPARSSGPVQGNAFVHTSNCRVRINAAFHAPASTSPKKWRRVCGFQTALHPQIPLTKWMQSPKSTKHQLMNLLTESKESRAVIPPQERNLTFSSVSLTFLSSALTVSSQMSLSLDPETSLRTVLCLQGSCTYGSGAGL